VTFHVIKVEIFTVRTNRSWN